MTYFTDEVDFNKEMPALLEILENQGFVMEADHPYAYLMQYQAAFDDVAAWLADNGYEGELNKQGYFEPGVGAVYGLYDVDRIPYEKMQEELKKEAARQAAME